MKIYIINLENAKKRREFQNQQCQKLELECEFFQALSAAEIDDKIYRKHYYDWQRPLKKNEMACYFSHRKIWEKILKNEAPALILEDDILLSKKIKNVLAKIQNFHKADLVNLENYARKKYVEKTRQKIDAHHDLVRLYLDRAGSAAYFLHPSGAQKLLQCEAQKGIAPADAHIHNCYSINAYQVEPAPATQACFARHYGIQADGLAGVIPSILYHRDQSGGVIPQPKKPGREWRFRKKRITAQLKLGIYQLKLLTFHGAKKRKIRLNSEDFS